MHEEMHSKVEYIVAHGISTFINTSKVIIGSHHFVFEDEACVIPEGKQEINTCYKSWEYEESASLKNYETDSSSGGFVFFI